MRQVATRLLCRSVLATVATVVAVNVASAQTKPLPSPTVPASKPARAMSTDVRYEPIDFATLPGWAADDHRAAFLAFTKSCVRLATLVQAKSAAFDATGPIAQRLVPLCHKTLAVAPEITTAAKARAFFESAFTAQRVIHRGPPGLLTGYYEPIIKGARVPSAQFPEPIYRRPTDLVNLVSEARRGAVGQSLTHVRKTAGGTAPFATRAEIDAGALKGQNLELLYLPDPVEVFFLQVQGSGQIELPDGTRVRVTYDAKNGHPYTSIGRYLIDKGIFDADRMSLQALGAWLRADIARGREVMRQNKSYVFFRELSGPEAEAPHGVLNMPLTTGRSLAIDPSHHLIGLPVYVSSTALTHATPLARGGFHRLMIAQDVGSAIKGPERGDIYFGSGPEAGKIAGVTKHPGNFFVLTPRDAPAADRPTTTLPKAQSKERPKEQP